LHRKWPKHSLQNVDVASKGDSPISRASDGAPGRRPVSGITSRRAPGHALVVWTMVGKVTFSSLLDALDRACELGLAEAVLWDAADADLTGLTQRDIERVVRALFEGPWAPRHWAILASSGDCLAACAVFAGMADDLGFGERFSAFLDRNDALTWLGCGSAPTTPAPAGVRFEGF
jgi:hypothetical protein